MNTVDQLNPEQREAVEAVTGPVAILAGAGTGKTTAITHRIARQIETGSFAAHQILAVTFTDKAAKEMVGRLERLGVPGVEARTFHSAALAQLHRHYEQASGKRVPEILSSKGALLHRLANSLPAPHKFRPRRELATEIEWAKNRRIGPPAYVHAVGEAGREPPIPAMLMQRIYTDYEKLKARSGQMDFEDLLELTLRMFDEYPETLEAVQARVQALTVDEFQDVNLLQFELITRWLGDRDELCVVGDDYQTIYSFTGASPHYLLEFPERFPKARLIKLVRNYRSTPQILDLANHVSAGMKGAFAKSLTPTREAGPPVQFRGFPDHAAEVVGIVAEITRLHADHVDYEEIAILVRINARTERFEEALAGAAIPYQVRDGDFLRRPAARAALPRIERRAPIEPDGRLVSAVEAATDTLGYDSAYAGDSEEEETRQADLLRLRDLACEFAAVNSEATGKDFVEDLRNRFQRGEDARGVNLLTYHRAKGLEWDAVFLPLMTDGELPYRHKGTLADPEEERRLLYVGVTRARSRLHISWGSRNPTALSSLLRDFAGAKKAIASPAKMHTPDDLGRRNPGGDPCFEALRAWRNDVASEANVPAYIVFHDRTLHAICETRPKTLDEFSQISGVGITKLNRYAEAVLAIVALQA